MRTAFPLAITLAVTLAGCSMPGGTERSTSLTDRAMHQEAPIHKDAPPVELAAVPLPSLPATLPSGPSSAPTSLPSVASNGAQSVAGAAPVLAAVAAVPAAAPAAVPAAVPAVVDPGAPLTAAGTARRPVPCDHDRAAGWVAAENAHPGGRIVTGTGGRDATVLGYLDRESVACGQRVGVHLGTLPRAGARTVTLEAYRIGWYQGTGARRVWHSGPVTVVSRDVPTGSATPHLVTPTWPQSLSVAITGDWPPGFYLLMPRDVGTGASAGPAIPMVLRNDGGAEPILFKASTLTWNAYNDWGGWSLYRGPSANPVRAEADRARVVAVHRPLVGPGYTQMATMDLPAVLQLERLAADGGAGAAPLDVAYTTDVDVDARPFQLSQHAEVVSGGHSEYWTTAMYNGLQLALKATVNVAFLGANNLWWRARLEGRTATGEPASQVVYRSAAEDPNHAVPTILWQAAAPPRIPAAVLGQSHAAIGVRGGLQLIAPEPWFTAGTALSAGALLPGAVGNEADGFVAGAPNPPSTRIFAAGLLKGSYGTVMTTVSFSTTPSGAAVFAAGTTDWACVPTGRCGGRTVPAATASAIGTMTRNVLVALSTRHVAAELSGTARTGSPLAGVRITAPAAIGTYGLAGTDETAAR